MKRTGLGWSMGRGRRLALAAITAALLAGCSDSPEEMLASAKSYLASNDLNAASIQLKNALQENANLAEARFLLGKVNLERGDVPGAAKELQRALDLGYEREQVVPLLARAWVRAAEFDRVLNEFKDVELADASARSMLLGAVADAHLAKANAADAARTYEAALAAQADNDDAAVGLARARLFGGDAAAAEEGARALVGRRPELATAHEVLAEILLTQGRVDEAIKAMEETVRIRPDAVGYHYALVSHLLQQNRAEEAAVRLEAMKKLAPASPSTRYLQAFVDFRDNRLKEARDGVLEVLQKNPDFMPAQLLAGSVLLRLNDHTQARTHLNAVLTRAPMHPLARRMLVASHLSSGEAARALELLQPLLEQPTEDARLLGLAGQVYLANGDFDKAETYLQTAVKAAPDDAQARLRLGVARLAGGDASGAFADLESASQMDAGAIQADLALVIAHMRQGELDKALEAQAQLEAKQPDNPLVANLRGRLMIARRDLPAARAAFAKALSLQPDYLAAALNLARLDLAEKRPQEALAHVQAIVDRNAKNVEALLALAELQAATGAAQGEVLATLNRAQAAAPTALPPALAIVLHHLRHRDFPQALAVAQKAEAAYPNDPRAVDMLARAQLGAGNTEQGIASLNRLAGLLPQSMTPLIVLAEVHRNARNSAAAEQALRRALAIRADSVDVQQRLVALLNERGDREAALKVARNVQKQHPGLAAGYTLEADVLAGDAKWTEAVASYRRALERNAGGDVATRLHAALLRGQRKAEADKLVADWLRERPKDLVMRAYLGERALAEKRYPEALRLFRTMSEVAPQNPLVLNNLAWTAGQLKDAKALEYAERAAALAPDNPAILDTLGVIQIDRGQAEKGLASLTRAVSLAPDLLPLRLNLVKAYARLGRSADARKELDGLMPKLREGTPLHTEALAVMKTL